MAGGRVLAPRFGPDRRLQRRPIVWSADETTDRFMSQHQLLKHAAPAAQEILDPSFLAQPRAK